MKSRICRYILFVVLLSILPARVNALLPPIILQNPSAAHVKDGESVEFKVAALGLNLSYQWYKNGVAIQGARATTLRIEKATVESAGKYYALVSNNFGSVRSGEAQLSVEPPPAPVVIVNHPSDQWVTPGSNVTLSVQATGSPGPFYQWILNGENIPGATSSTLTLKNIQAGDGGNYQVLVHNGIEVVTSDSAVVRVNLPALRFSDALAARGEITGAAGLGRGSNVDATHEAGEPYGGGINARKSVWLKWVAPATGYVTFSTAGSSFDTLLAGFEVTNGTFKILDTDDDGSDYHTSLIQFNVTAGTEYAIVVDGEDGSSGEIVLGWNLVQGRKMPVITSQPVSQTISLGQLLSFVLGVQYDGNYTVTWYLNGQPIPGLLGRILSFTRILGLPAICYAEIRTDRNEVFYSDEAEIQMNTEGLDAAARNKRLAAAGLGIGDSGQVNSGTLKLLNISGSVGYSGAQLFQTSPGRDPGEPSHCGVVGGASYWLSYTAPSTGLLTLNTDGSSFDTVLAVYTGGSSYSTMYGVACDNNSGADGRDSRLSLTVYAGQTYYIVVDGVNGAYGTAYLRYNLNTAPSISAPPSTSVQANGSSGPLTFTISDRETSASSLIVEAYSYNSSVIPSQNIMVSGSGSQRTVTVKAANGSGQVTIMLSVRDQSGLASYAYFTVNVTPGANQAPTASSDYVSRANRYGSTYIYIPNLLANDRDPNGDPISLYSFGNGSYGGRVSRSGDYLIYTPASSAYSSDSFSYTISDGKGGYSTTQVLITF